jgi:hypothetical protein
LSKQRCKTLDQNRITGHCEIIIIHLTKVTTSVTKDFKTNTKKKKEKNTGMEKVPAFQ